MKIALRHLVRTVEQDPRCLVIDPRKGFVLAAHCRRPLPLRAQAGRPTPVSPSPRLRHARTPRDVASHVHCAARMLGPDPEDFRARGVVRAGPRPHPSTVRHAGHLRAGADVDQAVDTLARWRHSVHLIHQLVQNDVSSTEVLFLRRGFIVCYLLAAPHVDCIEQHGLYVDDGAMPSAAVGVIQAEREEWKEKEMGASSSVAGSC